MSSLQAELQSSSNSRQELERQVQSAEGRIGALERQAEEGERSRQEMQGAAQQGKAAEVQVKARQARLSQATEATASIGRDLAHARSQVAHSPSLFSTAQPDGSLSLHHSLILSVMHAPLWTYHSAAA